MAGFLNISLGMELVTCSSPYPFWLGGMFILFGIVAILSEKYPSSCLIILNVVLNLFGVLFAIAAIVLYSIDLAMAKLVGLCFNRRHYGEGHPNRDYTECLAVKARLLLMARSIMVVLIVLAVLELCVTISCAVKGIKALKNSKNSEKTRNEEATEKSEKSACLFIVED